jgi:5-methylcytosine-specific restriction endonuclease McrA
VPRITFRQMKQFKSEAAAERDGLCCYCDSPMWEADPIAFSIANQVAAEFLWCFQCTTEHIVARTDGGRNGRENIAAACRLCNQRRHEAPSPLSFEEFRVFVQDEIRQGRWTLRPSSLRGSRLMTQGRHRLDRLIANLSDDR